MKSPQERAADLRYFIAQAQHNADNSPVASRERRSWKAQIKYLRQDLQRLRSRYKHLNL